MRWIWLLVVGCSGGDDSGLEPGLEDGETISISPQDWWWISGRYVYTEEGGAPDQGLNVYNDQPFGDYESPPRYGATFLEGLVEDGQVTQGLGLGIDYHYGDDKSGLWFSTLENGGGLQVLAAEMEVGSIVGEPWQDGAFRFVGVEACDGDGGACLRLEIESSDAQNIGSFQLQRGQLPPRQVVIDMDLDGIFRAWNYEGEAQ